MSIITAVWCIKSVDNNMFSAYKNDVNIYRASKSHTGIIFMFYILKLNSINI